MRITLIAAVSDDGIIACDNRIPWHLPRDVRQFRDYCEGKFLLLGRKTYDQMQGWFGNHFPLILTRNPQLAPSGGKAVYSVSESINLAQEELVVLGGAGVYAAALPYATQLRITRVHTRIGQGLVFPEVGWNNWRVGESTFFAPDEENSLAMTLATFHRIACP